MKGAGWRQRRRTDGRGRVFDRLQDDHHEVEGIWNPEDFAAGAVDDHRAEPGDAAKFSQRHAGNATAAANDE